MGVFFEGHCGTKWDIGCFRPTLYSGLCGVMIDYMFVFVKCRVGGVSVQSSWDEHPLPLWIPAFAGMTVAVCVERSHEA